jgi:hypothetical protein
VAPAVADDLAEGDRSNVTSQTEKFGDESRFSVRLNVAVKARARRDMSPENIPGPKTVVGQNGSEDK